MSQNLPIGIFDSGLGGLTVLKELITQFPKENFIYVGDTARLPYGSKSPKTIKNYVTQILKYLNSLNVKAIVVACNSASSVLKISDSAIPIYDVISPGAAEAANLTQNNKVGILATRATVEQKAYPIALDKIKTEIKTHQVAAPLLVPLVEEGWSEDPLTNLVVHRYVQPLVNTEIDTLIMGCTHYPILKTSIKKVAGQDIHLVDSAKAISKWIQMDFNEGLLMANDGNKKRSIKLYSTDLHSNYQTIAKKIMAPHDIEPFIQAEL